MITNIYKRVKHIAAKADCAGRIEREYWLGKEFQVRTEVVSYFIVFKTKTNLEEGI